VRNTFKVFGFIAIAVIISFSMTTCDSGFGSNGGSGGPKTITITGIPSSTLTDPWYKKVGVYDVGIFISNPANAWSPVAVGGGNVSGGSVTVSLKDPEGSDFIDYMEAVTDPYLSLVPWTGSGSFGIELCINCSRNYYLYTAGKTWDEIDTDPLYMLYNITSASTTIPFSQFSR